MNFNRADIQHVDRFIINGETMALLPMLQPENIYTHMIGLKEEKIVSKRPSYVIDHSCRYYGSSFQGRRVGTKELIGITHKPPIVIDPSNSIYFFPTTSPTKPQCAWLSHSHITNFQKVENNRTSIQFMNGTSITVDVSFNSFSNQFYRTAQLRTVVTSRIEEEQRKLNLMLFHDGQKSMLYEQIIREFRKGIK